MIAVTLTLNPSWTWLWLYPGLGLFIMACAGTATFIGSVRKHSRKTAMVELAFMAIAIPAMIACFDRV